MVVSGHESAFEKAIETILPLLMCGSKVYFSQDVYS